MLMQEALVKLALEGRKTQTRRPYDPAKTDFNGTVKTGFGSAELSQPIYADAYGYTADEIARIYVNNRLKWAVGQDYALQYGRGLPTRWWQPKTNRLLEYADYDNFWNTAIDEWCPLQIRVTRLRFEDVRNINLEDAIAEGFENQQGFWKVWTGFYDKPAVKVLRDSYTRLFEEHYLKTRPSNLYQAVAIDFEVVR